MTTRLLLPTLLLCLPLAACGNHDAGKTDPATGKSASPAAETSTVGKTVQDATDKARKELAQSNISVSNGQSDKAEITPQGELLINGKAVTTDASQRALLLDYRKQVEAVAGAGMDIGVAGANLGVKAAGEALKGIFSGDTQGIEERVNAEASKIEAQAKQLCTLLPGMMAKQQALAAALPAFKPYASMDQSDIDDCGK
ncbi:YggN family protein [Bacillus subtilis subsp. subtilis]|nr:YggN family protein [Bacillus subtilis subsp. subtilis]